MAPKKLKDIAHRRFDPLKGTWVLLASPQKNKRPRQGQREVVTASEKQAYDPNCYLCPGNTRANGIRNPEYTGTFAFENDFSTVRMDEGECHQHTPEIDVAPDLLRVEPVIGRCYVLTYSAIHHYNISDMTAQDVLCIVDAWTRIYSRYLSSDSPLRMSTTSADDHGPSSREETTLENTNLRYMHVFDNNGEIVGCSNTHPHGQIWITSSMPDGPSQEIAQMSRYRQYHGGRHMLQDYVRLEMDKEERIVWQNDGFLAVCPWWAVWPYEVLLLPKRQVRGLVDLSQTEKFQFSEAILQVAKLYDNLFETTFPYISALHQAPLNATEGELESSYLHMHFSPPLLFPSIKKFFGGYELYAEPTREITPETAAARLRHSGAQLLMSSCRSKAVGSQAQEEFMLIGSPGETLRSGETSSWWRQGL
ncbi:uncharacterized protein ASPGLDRAFT_52061 [Aspergillus glaucus CBS 516.65]|uniref:Galactose-1-phosphate uridylyltransferase n=1 Tax=Aspergillus glaucus CBS 516.65 TaxID=1160497 RepID=A0A1L9V7M3_ASPGL|nr:hypothetical protein ASPGLDRAFT_52061 [Aspergillus glaucus CBS 516.65]OJJ79842.1 hypothetical protein ASPGLDRAFT_52061 [Aspergillus glaucus CBS 516.65]